MCKNAHFNVLDEYMAYKLPFKKIRKIPDEVYHLSHLQRPDPEDAKQAA
jgi:hypothetical protein